MQKKTQLSGYKIDGVIQKNNNQNGAYLELEKTAWKSGHWVIPHLMPDQDKHTS